MPQLQTACMQACCVVCKACVPCCAACLRCPPHPPDFNSCRLYEVNSNNPQPIISYDGHTSNVTSVGFQKDGKWMYSGSEDGTGEAGCHGGGLGDQERKGTGAPISVPAVGTEAGV